MRPDDLYTLPPNLPVPEDDGACLHLTGMAVPAVELPSTAGRAVRLDEPVNGVTVVYCYPRTGRPDRDSPGGASAWNAVPGARGCTPQTCAYRDRFAQLQTLGAQLFGLSTQTTEEQIEAVNRLRLPFELLSDERLAFTHSLSLPTFEHAGFRFIKRLTLIIEQGRIAACFYPVFPPDADADRVLAWLRKRAAQPA
jgi:peroxiredoxin